jgi:hypothetical protein
MRLRANAIDRETIVGKDVPRKVNRSGDRHRLESSGGSPLRIETAAFLRMPNQSGLWRPFEAGRHQKVWRSTRRASASSSFC